MQPIQAGEVEVATAHDVERPGLDDEQVERFDVAELAAGDVNEGRDQLRERHDAALILAGEALDVAIATVALNAAPEAVLGHLLQQLTEDEFARIPAAIPSLSGKGRQAAGAA